MRYLIYTVLLAVFTLARLLERRAALQSKFGMCLETTFEIFFNAFIS
jgi:hypothetical protein